MIAVWFPCLFVCFLNIHPFIVLISGEFSQICFIRTHSEVFDLQRLFPNLFINHIQYLINVILNMIPNSLIRAALCIDEDIDIQSTRNSSVNKLVFYFDTPHYVSTHFSTYIPPWLTVVIQAQKCISDCRMQSFKAQVSSSLLTHDLWILV